MFNLNQSSFRLSLIAAGLVTSLSQTNAFAQTNENTVLVTATRFEQSLSEVPGDVTVIERDEIQRSGAGNLIDVLKKVPGFQFSQNGGARQTTSLYIRGHKSQHVLVMIDGRRIGAFDGATNAQIQNFPVQQIERIEVLKGPASALYGSDAIAGVIQIITRQPLTSTFDFAAKVGSNDTFGVDVLKSAPFGKSSFSVAAGYETSEGFSAVKDTTENDGFDSRYVNFGFQSKLTDQISLSMDAAQVNSTVEYDGFSSIAPFPPIDAANEADTELRNLGAQLTMSWNETQNTRLSIGKTEENREFRSSFPGVFEYEQFQADLEHRVNFSAGQLLVGLAHLNQDFNSTSQSSAGLGETTSDSVTAAYFGNVGRTNYQFSVRQDFYSDVSDKATGQFGVGHQLSDSYSVGLSAGTGFRRPTPSEIIGFSTPGSINANLKPESSVNYEIYLQGAYQQVDWRITAYENKIDDLLAFDFATQGYQNQPGKSTFQGISAKANWLMAGFNMQALFDLTSAKNASGQRLGRVALHTFNLSVARAFGDWRASVDWLLVSDRVNSEFDVTPVRLSGYGLINASVVWQFDRQQSLTLRIDNLFRQDYEIAQGYNVPKRDVLLTYQLAI